MDCTHVGSATAFHKNLETLHGRNLTNQLKRNLKHTSIFDYTHVGSATVFFKDLVTVARENSNLTATASLELGKIFPGAGSHKMNDRTEHAFSKLLTYCNTIQILQHNPLPFSFSLSYPWTESWPLCITSRRGEKWRGWLLADHIAII